LVRRARQPGCKFDYVVVFEGPENRGKSAAVEALAGDPESFSDQSILDVSEQRQQENMKGRLVYEIAELDGMTRAEISKVKAFVSRTSDRVRKVYARNPEDQPRRNIFIATTNDKDYLKDANGNRRWLPIEIGGFPDEAAALKKDRRQLLGEAAVAETAGEALNFSTEIEALARAQQSARVEDDPWAEHLDPDRIVTNLDGTLVQFTNDGARVRRSTLAQLVGLQRKDMNNAVGKKLARAARRAGWLGPVREGNEQWFFTTTPIDWTM
jgi:predicted P-loop ATPase